MVTSTREQFYKRRIAELEAQLRQHDERIAKDGNILPPKSAAISKRFVKHGDAKAREPFGDYASLNMPP